MNLFVHETIYNMTFNAYHCLLLLCHVVYDRMQFFKKQYVQTWDVHSINRLKKYMFLPSTSSSYNFI